MVSGVRGRQRSLNSRYGICVIPYVVGDLGGLSAYHDIQPGFLIDFQASPLAKD